MSSGCAFQWCSRHYGNPSRSRGTEATISEWRNFIKLLFSGFLWVFLPSFDYCLVIFAVYSVVYRDFPLWTFFLFRRVLYVCGCVFIRSSLFGPFRGLYRPVESYLLYFLMPSRADLSSKYFSCKLRFLDVLKIYIFKELCQILTAGSSLGPECCFEMTSYQSHIWQTWAKSHSYLFKCEQ